MAPESLLPDIANLLMAGNLPNSGIMLPVKEFSARNRLITFGKFASSVGIVEDSMLLNNHKSVRFFNNPLYRKKSGTRACEELEALQEGTQMATRVNIVLHFCRNRPRQGSSGY